MADVFVFKVPCGEKCSGYQENLKKINKLTFLKCLDANVKIFILPRITLIAMLCNVCQHRSHATACRLVWNQATQNIRFWTWKKPLCMRDSLPLQVDAMIFQVKMFLDDNVLVYMSM